MTAYFDPDVIAGLLESFERDVSDCETFYNGIGSDTIQKREQYKMIRQRTTDTANRLKALLALPAKDSKAQSRKDTQVRDAQRLLNRYTDIQRKTVEVEGEIVSHLRKSLSSGSSRNDGEIRLTNQIVLKSVDVTQEMLKEYNEELQKATENMKELQDIAREMNKLAEEQGQKLTQAERQARDADTEVIVGVGQVKKASKYNCSQRWCTVIIICVIVGILIVIGLAVGIPLGLKARKKN